MSERCEIRLSGSGGQGLILIGKILAEAAAIYDGKNATQSQSYGPEARGGASRSEVIVSDGDIDYPKAENLDVLLAMTQEAADKYARDLKPGGVLIVDERFVRTVPEPLGGTAHRVPITELAEREAGKAIVANLVALGLIVALSAVVSERSARAALVARVPKGTEAMNLKAFEAGLRYARERLLGAAPSATAAAEPPVAP